MTEQLIDYAALKIAFYSADLSTHIYVEDSAYPNNRRLIRCGFKDEATALKAIEKHKKIGRWDVPPKTEQDV